MRERFCGGRAVAHALWIVLITVMACVTSPRAAPVGEAVDLPSASGGTQHVWIFTPEKPWAVAIMFVGNNGLLSRDIDGSVRSDNSIVVRTRQLWLDRGVAVVIPGKPSSVTVDYNYRLTGEYAQDVKTLVDFARARTGAPVWLMGHSLGTNAVASAATRLTHGEIAGVVFVAPIIVHGPGSALNEDVFDVPLDAINVPALFVAHENDGCPNAGPEGPAKVRAKVISAPATEVMLFSGGQPSGDACAPTSFHALVGQDADFVGRVSDWMRNR